MKKILITMCLAALVMAAKADSGQYTINDQAVESVFAKGVDISTQLLSTTGMDNLLAASGLNTNASAFSSAAGQKDFAVALILNIFLGGLGLHRLYLGTKTMTWVGYILTCGGIFGVVPLVDLIVLIVHNQDISPYVDNTKFFMWANS